MTQAVEEMLRYCGPVQSTKPNYAAESRTLSGVEIKQGEMVFPLLGAANRDPAQFDDPDRFDIGRAIRPNLGLGSGIHFCLGASLARLETARSLAALLERFSTIELGAPRSQLKRSRALLWYRLTELPVRLRR